FFSCFLARRLLGHKRLDLQNSASVPQNNKMKNPGGQAVKCIFYESPKDEHLQIIVELPAITTYPQQLQRVKKHHPIELKCLTKNSRGVFCFALTFQTCNKLLLANIEADHLKERPK
ncbi:MAG: hypothetical protein WC100_17655, partial [Sterolibacterium sp.]